MKSVRNPGVSSNSPPIRISTPSKISSPGKAAPEAACVRRRRARRPWLRASSAPVAPVATTIAIVGRTPRLCPTRINRASSTTGVTVNSRKSWPPHGAGNIPGPPDPVDGRFHR